MSVDELSRNRCIHIVSKGYDVAVVECGSGADVNRLLLCEWLLIVFIEDLSFAPFSLKL